MQYVCTVYDVYSADHFANRAACLYWYGPLNITTKTKNFPYLKCMILLWVASPSLDHLKSKWEDDFGEKILDEIWKSSIDPQNLHMCQT